VHVVGDNAIFAQLKKRKSEAEQTADQKLIRNYDNGWVFCPVDLATISQEIRDVSVRAVRGLELDFGAVDLVIANDSNSPVALEVNSAPGLSSPGLIQAYADAFLKELSE
jgi:D-alanine-D-alanine ligase-like ATP-grasp enzyme